MHTQLASVVLLLGWPIMATAQQPYSEHTMKLAEGEQPAAASIEDVAWLAGYWLGEGLGGQCEEMWTAPVAGAMLGTFRLVKDDQLQFSEFFILAEQDDSLVLKLKHFDPKFAGWEERDKFVTFQFIKAEGKTAWFEGLTYQLSEDGQLHVHVAMRGKDGTVGEGHFRYQPAEQ